ncbi:MAG: hypothetical protein ACI91Z_000013 [Yoonia sp.]|jgi:hypothetical protein
MRADDASTANIIMIGLVLITRNEGPQLDEALAQLVHIHTDGIPIVVIDLGSTDDTVARLKSFSRHRPFEVVSLDASALTQLDALRIGADLTRAPYVMTLGAQDRLLPAGFEALKVMLGDAEIAPDLIVLNSGFWFADPSHPILRADHTAAASLSPAASPYDLLGLCPDPRRLVLSRDAVVLSNDADTQLTGGELYAACVSKSTQPMFCRALTLLHPSGRTDVAPQLWQLLADLKASSRRARMTLLDRVLIWSDDAVLNCAPEQAPQLCAALRGIARILPRVAYHKAITHTGPSGALFGALKSRSDASALSVFALAALARQQRDVDRLVRHNGDLMITLKSALPSPKELRRLYDRARVL